MTYAGPIQVGLRSTNCNHMGLPLRIALNSIASEAFRDQADRDYVLARAAWRLRLRDQFLWSAQQAIEKYLKGILLFDGRSARYIPGSGTGKKRKEYRHSLTALSASVDALPGYQIAHPPWWQEYIERLEYFGQNRYVTRNARTRFNALDSLDEAVWSVRRYCQHMRFDHKHIAADSMLTAYMNTANDPSYKKNPHRLTLIGGQLEKWIADRSDPARASLIWNNRFFGRRPKGNPEYVMWSSFVNAPVHRDWAQEPTLRTQLAEYFRFD